MRFNFYPVTLLLLFVSFALLPACSTDHTFANIPASAITAQNPNPPLDTGNNPNPNPTSTACVPSSSNFQITTTAPNNFDSICPAVGHDSKCGVVIIVADGGISIYFSGQGPYDGHDDTLVGVVNNSSQPLYSLNLQSKLDIFGFDGDGISNNNNVPSNFMDQTGYGGPNTYFSNYGGSNETGTVNFVNPLAAGGGTTYFALENSLTSSNSCLSGGS